jgi:hypothetical protein
MPIPSFTTWTTSLHPTTGIGSRKLSYLIFPANIDPADATDECKPAMMWAVSLNTRQY